MTKDDRHASELTDAQLDQVLATANKGLLYHIEGTADLDDAMRAIIARASQDSPPLEQKGDSGSNIAPLAGSRPEEFTTDPYRSTNDAHNPQGGSAVGDPTVLKILLGAQLRRLREAAGVTRDDAGYHIRAAGSKIARLELGRVSFKERDVSDLLDLYHVGGEQRGQLAELAREANATPWWQRYRDVVPDWFQVYVGLEEAATLIRVYEVQFVPGLLQTEKYARAIAVQGSPDLGPEEVDRRAEVCMSRQRLLTREDPPRMWAIVDEAALRRPIGGRDVLAGQLKRLIDAVSDPNITLQVLPFGYGGHAAMGGAFTLMRFPEADLPDVVYMEYLTGALYIDKTAEVDVYSSAMERLSVAATSPARTRDILNEILKELLSREVPRRGVTPLVP